jgi:hypothetical protein
MLSSWNVRGLNKSGKVKEISSRLKTTKPDIMILIETRVKVGNAKNIRDKLNLYDRYIDNYGKHDNGRIWITWNDSKVDVRLIDSTDQLIHCGIFDVMGKLLYWLTAVYGKNQNGLRKHLWRDIMNLKPSSLEPWCVMGDFNNVAYAHDRIGGRMVQEYEYADFQDMMIKSGLSEMDSVGDYFTWCNKHANEPIYSRIDRLLGNVEWFKQYHDWNLNILEPSISDHAMLLVSKDTQIQKITRRFRFYNYIVGLPGYEETVRNSWSKPAGGSPMVRLWRKLQRLKPELNKFSASMATLKADLKGARDKLEQAQVDLNADRMNRSKMDRVKSCTDELMQLHDVEEKVMLQKSKIDWLRWSDENSGYFHASVKAKTKNRSMKMLKRSDGTYVTDQSSIMKEVFEFYQNLMGTRNDTLRHVDIEVLRNGAQISAVHAEMLTKDVGEKEIWEALKDIGDMKAPGMDGYNSKFFKASWKIVKDDVISAVQDYFVNGNLSKAFNSTVVTLIPKHDLANEVKDFRPIAGCTTVYKIVSKVLTNRLGRVLPDVIRKSQAAFMKGQVIHNHILLACELLNGYNRKGGTPRCMFQIDLQKAYDMVDWRALETILCEIGIPNKFVQWIMLGVTTVNYRFNVNGEYTEVLDARRGIRQGDPISPLLFVIMMEYLNRVLGKMSKEPHFKFHSKCSKLNLTHLAFADDVLLFCRGDLQSVEKLFEAFNAFSDATGLVMNPRKCKASFGGVEDDQKNKVLQTTGFTEGNFPVRYLGIPLSSKKLAISHYLPLIDKIVSRIRHWTSHLLSIAGRIQLVKSVITAITQYWMFTMPIPVAVTKKIGNICRSFIWSGKSTQSKKSPVAWVKVCRPVKQGGLNILNLQVWNQIALLKCLWNICLEGDNLWVKWVHSYFLKGRNCLAEFEAKNCTWIMKAIMDRKKDVIKIQQLWHDMITCRKFNMMQVYKVMIEDNCRFEWYGIISHNFARPRAKVISWLACQDRLPTKARLMKFNLLQHAMCEKCHNVEEDRDHVLFVCKDSMSIWNKILSWLNMQIQQNMSMDWIKRNIKGKGWRKRVLKAAVTETIYGLWMFRNSKIFGNSGKYSDIENVTKAIMDAIVYRGWMIPIVRKNIVELLM